MPNHFQKQFYQKKSCAAIRLMREKTNSTSTLFENSKLKSFLMSDNITSQTIEIYMLEKSRQTKKQT